MNTINFEFVHAAAVKMQDYPFALSEQMIRDAMTVMVMMPVTDAGKESQAFIDAYDILKATLLEYARLEREQADSKIESQHCDH